MVTSTSALSAQINKLAYFVSFRIISSLQLVSETTYKQDLSTFKIRVLQSEQYVL